jgi:hypothetical protein
VPLRATLNGLPGTFVAMLKAALSCPGATGEKRTLIVRLAPGARLPAPPPSVMLKLAASEPVRLMLLIWSGAVPVLVRVTL